MRRKDLEDLVRAEFEASDGTRGYRCITARLKRGGAAAHCDTVRRLVRRAGLVAGRGAGDGSSLCRW